MKTQLICAALLIIGVGAVGCGAVPEPPVACTAEANQYCEVLGMECNEARPLVAECEEFVVELQGYIRDVLIPMISDSLSFLPSFIDIDELVAMLFDQYVGICGEAEFPDEVCTCQPLGNEGDVCAESADCLGDLACPQGICAVPECLQQDHCPDPGACHVGFCDLLTGACQSTPVSCDDSDVCTDDFCYPDVGCSSELTTTPPEAEETTCDDGVDNDCDGAVDSEDTDCIWCGNGIVEGDEVCDDGNTVSGDGCSADCLEVA